MFARKMIVGMVVLGVVFIGLIIGGRTQAVVSKDSKGVGYSEGNLKIETQAVNGPGLPVILTAGNEWDTMLGDEKAAEQPRCKRDEIIVKFKRAVADVLEQQLARRVENKNLRLSTSLDNLNRKHKVVTIEPAFKDFKANCERMKNLVKKDHKRLSSDEKKILKRLQRAPKDAKVPELDRIYIVKIEEGQSVEQAVADYSKDPAVEYAELNYIVKVCLTPDDPCYPVQWPLNNTGQMYPASGYYRQPPGTSGCDINAPEAWNIHTGSSEIVVAVIDTGVNYNHRDLQGNIWVNIDEILGDGLDNDDNNYIDDFYGYDFCQYNQLRDSDPMDEMGHGTHCAGIIAARTDNFLDIAGVSWNAKIMAVKFLDRSGYGYLSDGAASILYATYNDADILSNSWSWGTEPEESNDVNTVREAIEYAVSQGVIVVAAAANDGISSPVYPAAYDHVISVAATDSNDDRASFSNYGNWVDIAAPGVDILSLRGALLSIIGKPFGKTWTVASGTSMACPHVAGACALLLSVNSPLSSDDANMILRNTADKLDDPCLCASGRLNIDRAIRNAVSSMGYINVDRPSYGRDTNIGILVSDLDLAGANACDIILDTNGGDLETATLSEVEFGVGIFTGSILTGAGAPCVGDRILQLSDGQIIMGTYYDEDDGTGNSAEPNDMAMADCISPVISAVNFTEQLVGPEQIVTFQTSKLTTARIICGSSCDQPNIVTGFINPRLNYAIKFKGLEPLTDYFFKIEATDLAGNTVVDSNGGSCYWFVTDEGPRDINVPNDYSTIQEAVDAAWDKSTVWLDDETYTGVGNREVDFKGRSITLRSISGPNDCIIDCQGEYRAFLVQNEECVMLKDLTIKNGLAIMDSDYNDLNSFGGAIRNIAGDSKIDGCIFKANSGLAGGALYSWDGDIEINNCSFTENDGNSGGAIAQQLKQLIITNCFFSENTADSSGGAVLASNLDQLLDHCIFINNNAEIYGGGAVSQFVGSVNATNCAFINNSCGEYGGGVSLRNWPFGLNGTFSNCTFSGNKAGIAGGGFFQKSSYINFIDCIVWGNGANGLRDEIFSDGYSNFNHCDINGCGGSGIDWDIILGYDEGNNIDEDPLFTDANLHISEDSPCVDAGNTNSDYGQTDIDGDLRVQGLCVDIGADELPRRVRNITDKESYLNIQDAINDASNGDEIIVYPGVYYEIIDFNGLAIVVRGADANDWDVVGSTVIDGNNATNVASFDSGENGNSLLTGVTVKGGTNGVFCLNSSPTITNCIIRNNTTRGIYDFYGGAPTITNNKIFDNGNYGIYLNRNAQGTIIKNNLIHDVNYGIHIIYPQAAALITNNTIVHNQKRGIGKFLVGPSPAITNCIVWDCNDDLYGCNATYSCIEDGDAGTGNISADPCFVYTDNNDFHIDLISSCVDNGNPNGNYDGQTDIDGLPRLRNQYVDIGADEVWRRVCNITNGNWYTQIQDAINEASGGDEIVVSSGTYYESVNFNGRSVTVRSSDPNDWNVVAQTVIDCQISMQLPRWQWSRNGFIFENGEDGNSILAGFTVKNGIGLIAYDIQSGGAIFCDGSSPTIRRCILKNNDLTMTYLDSGGGAIVCFFGANPLIDNCIISENKVSWGGAIGIWESSPIIRNCIIWGNSSSYGGGIALWMSTDCTIQNCTIVNNSADSGGGIFGAESTPAITNCILWGNGDDLDGCSATYSCIQDGDAGTGNIYSDPCFYDADNNDFHVKRDSNCIDAGDPDFSDYNEMDIDGQCRVMKGKTQVRVDIGADEYYWPKADFDKDGIVNFFDFAMFAPAWLTTDANISLDEDGDVDMDDLAQFCQDWL